MKKLIALLTATCAVASMNTVQAEPWEGFYLNGFVGASFVQTDKNDRRHNNNSSSDSCNTPVVTTDSSSESSNTDGRRRHKLEFDTGYLVGGAVGYHMCSGLRFEGEISYRYNTLKSRNEKGSSYEGYHQKHKRRGHIRDISYMANALYDFDLSCWNCCWTCGNEIIPYIGAGIGYSDQRLKVSRNKSFDGDDSDLTLDDSSSRRRHKGEKKGFGYQIIAGIAWEFMPCADAAIEYRFHQGQENKLYFHAVDLALKWHF